MKRRHLVIIILALIFSLEVFAAGVQAQISQVGDSIHLEFKGLAQWDYSVEKKPSKTNTIVLIEVPRLSEPAVMALKSFQSTLIESITVKHDGPDNKDIIQVRLPSTEVDSFDYLTDQPSRLIVDIFKPVQKKPNQVAKKTPALPKKKEGQALNAKEEFKATPQRAPSSTDVLKISESGANQTEEAQLLFGKTDAGIFDGGDPDFNRFTIKDYEIKEEAIIASKRNYYLEFPMLKMENNQLVRLNSAKPIYDIEPKETEENKQARLLLTLFENKRYNVFLKTVDWFYKKFPNSEYDELIRFMWADTHFALWNEKRDIREFELGMLRYKQALEKYPNNPLYERTVMLMGFANMDRGDYLDSLRLFQNHLITRPKTPNRDIARHAIAEAYLKLNRFEDAYQTLDEIEKQASDKKYQIRAAYLKGDVFYKKGEFQRAIDEYNHAIKKYPEGASEFPNAFYNQASALFNQNRYRQSLDEYISFLKKFPSHDYAAFSMTRVGEILEILGAEKSRSIGAYLETYFRYGDRPGSVVARLRLLSERMKNMKPKEAEKAVSDIMELAKKSELAKIQQFATVLIAEGYSSRLDYEKSIDLLVKYYQENPTTADTVLLSNRIVKYINLKFQDQVDEGNFIEALKTHKRFAESWLKTSDRIDTKYNVGRAYEQAGVPKEADKMYRDSLNKILALRGTSAEKEVNVFERLPTTDEIYLRLAQVTLQQEQYSTAYENLKEIKNPEKLTEVQQIERVHVGAALLEKKGDINSAVRHLVELIKTWKGVPHLVAEPYLTLGQLELRQGKRDEAIKSFQKVDQLMNDSGGKVAEATHIKALESLAQIYKEKDQIDLSLATYEKLLDRYEATRPMESTRYRVGQIYFDRGEIQKANDTWSKLKDRKNEFWYKLAQEQLKNSEWSEEYKKYIKRIPAMSERK